MKHEVTSLNTKKIIAASLKKFMEEKTLSRITVSEIVADCGINRKTFYYHFEDIQSLLKWILEQEAVDVVKQFDMLLDYDEAISFVMDYVEDNKHILNCAYDAMGRDELKQFLNNDLSGIMLSIVTRIEEIMGLYLKEDYRDFVCDFYMEALSGKIVELLKNNRPYDRNKLIDYVSVTIKASLTAIIREAGDKKISR